MNSRNFKLSKESLDKLADAHIELFSERLEEGPRGGIREGECRRYLSIWEGVKAAPNWDTLSEAAIGEVIDAMAEGSFGDCLTADELALFGNIDWEEDTQPAGKT